MGLGGTDRVAWGVSAPPPIYPLFRICGAKVGCYIHYPTISSDMLKKVEARRGDFNNRQFIANSSILSRTKLFYYHIFTWLYAFCGRRSKVIMSNSSWTANHLDYLWSLKSTKIFP